jgi:hypothetical protein
MTLNISMLLGRILSRKEKILKDNLDLLFLLINSVGQKARSYKAAIKKCNNR